MKEIEKGIILFNFFFFLLVTTNAHIPAGFFSPLFSADYRRPRKYRSQNSVCQNCVFHDVFEQTANSCYSLRKKIYSNNKYIKILCSNGQWRTKLGEKGSKKKKRKQHPEHNNKNNNNLNIDGVGAMLVYKNMLIIAGCQNLDVGAVNAPNYRRHLGLGIKLLLQCNDRPPKFKI